MKERPILFSGPMVRAILEGRKTQTRRVVKPQPPEFVQHTPDVHPAKHPAPYIDAYCSQRKTEANPRGMGLTWCWWTKDDRQGDVIGRCPYGHPGDRLWVRESCSISIDKDAVMYRDNLTGGGKLAPTAPPESEAWAREWRPCPSIHMPRWASRLLLEVESIRVERVHEISEADAAAEGVDVYDGIGKEQRVPGPGFDGVRMWDEPHRLPFSDLWDEINEKRGYGWDVNPWVWVVTFKVVA